MTTLWSPFALLPEGWAQDVIVNIDNSGKIANISVGNKPVGQTVGTLLPAPVNVHSHAFQRAMAGLTEARSPNPKDTFWTWRKLMYQFLDQLDPDQVQAITALVQMEMLEAGYATNVEFHYLHHRPGGNAYDTLSEMAQRICTAATQTGIGLTLLPVHYQFGGCNRSDLGPGQIRFGNSPEQFARLVEESETALSELPGDSVLGVAPHSLRAVAPEDLKQIHTLTNGPIHLHLVEQLKEVAEVQTAWGYRPVEWLLANIDVNSRWCLIHCTQMKPHETIGLAKTGAVAGLCPITESSLGDGIFDGVRWIEHGGKIAIGSDSNIRISLCEELRTLEYSQRLRDRSRAALATSSHSTGRRLFDAICQGGARAAGRKTGKIAPGYWADFLTLDDHHIDLAGRSGDTLLDSFVFAGDNRMIRDVWAAGRHVVKDGSHVARQEILASYLKAIEPLHGL